MIDWAAAWARANEYVAGLELPEDEVVINQEQTREYDFGWVFMYNSRRYLEQGERKRAMVGNVPFIVDRRDGSIHLTRTNWREAIFEYSQRYQAETGGEVTST